MNSYNQHLGGFFFEKLHPIVGSRTVILIESVQFGFGSPFLAIHEVLHHSFSSIYAVGSSDSYWAVNWIAQIALKIFQISSSFKMIGVCYHLPFHNKPFFHLSRHDMHNLMYFHSIVAWKRRHFAGIYQSTGFVWLLISYHHKQLHLTHNPQPMLQRLHHCIGSNLSTFSVHCSHAIFERLLICSTQIFG